MVLDEQAQEAHGFLTECPGLMVVGGVEEKGVAGVDRQQERFDGSVAFPDSERFVGVTELRPVAGEAGLASEPANTPAYQLFIHEKQNLILGNFCQGAAETGSYLMEWEDAPDGGETVTIENPCSRTMTSEVTVFARFGDEDPPYEVHVGISPEARPLPHP